MIKTEQYNRQQGFLIIDIIVAMTIISMLVVGMALVLKGYQKVNRMYLARTTCIHAAEAVLDSYTTTGTGLDLEEINKLWPGLDIKTDVTAGKGQWEGTQLINVVSRSDKDGRSAEIKMQRYIVPNKVIPADGDKTLSADAGEVSYRRVP